MERPKVSLYIPCFNVAQFIEGCIEGVLAQTYPVDEVLIIDDGSEDNTLGLASQYPVKIIKHPVNKGLAAARNTAFREASHALVASLDADCVPLPDWLSSLMPLLENPRVGAVGGKLVETALYSHADYWRKAHLSQDWGDTKIHNPMFIHGNNNVLRKSLVLASGGYDEAMRTNSEDADISRQIREQGYDLIYEPSAVVNHRRQDSLASIFDTYWRYWRFGAKAFLGQSSWVDLLRHCARHLVLDLSSAIKCDLESQNYGLLATDMLLPGYMIYRDVQAFISQPKS